MKQPVKNTDRTRILRKWSIPRDPITLTLVTALFLLLFDNRSFWDALMKILQVPSISNIGLFISVFFTLLAFFSVLLTLFSFRFLFKPTVILILTTSSIAGYFMDSYGIMIDRNMMQNVIETDAREVIELLNFRLFLTFVFLGILPSIIIVKTKILYSRFRTGLLEKFILVSISIAIIAGNLVLFYGDYISVGRNHKHIRHLINPINFLYASGSAIKHCLDDDRAQIKPIGRDAHLTTTRKNDEKKTLTIFVLGEAARAENFALNGYPRNTNPRLSKKDIVYFSNFYSCGTSTAVSVPCIFSLLNRDSFSIAKGKKYENLLDVLAHAGLNVLWRENNSGCKGVCDRVETEIMAYSQIPEFCSTTTAECRDEILLYQLQDYVDRLENDAFIVLHQKGSHGPAYYLRYPDKFAVFQPECRNQEIRECDDEDIVNAYDNTILYTDYFLAQVIEFLERNSDKYNTTMLYVSDHGQSLGENNIYLHGFPYMIAPDVQKHIPFIVWLSDGFVDRFGIDKCRLQKKSNDIYTHDNLFHTILKITGVNTAIYDAGLDIMAGTDQPPGTGNADVAPSKM